MSIVWQIIMLLITASVSFVFGGLLERKKMKFSSDLTLMRKIDSLLPENVISELDYSILAANHITEHNLDYIAKFRDYSKKIPSVFLDRKINNKYFAFKKIFDELMKFAFDYGKLDQGLEIFHIYKGNETKYEELKKELDDKFRKTYKAYKDFRLIAKNRLYI